MQSPIRKLASSFSSVKNIWSQMNKKERYFIGATLLARLCLVSLDLVGIFLVGVVVSILSGTTISPTSNLSNLLSVFRSMGFQNGYAVLLFAAVVFFVLKGLVAVGINKVTAKFVARIEWKKSLEAFSILQRNPIDFIEQYKQQDLLFAATGSVTALTTQAILVGATITSEVALLIAVAGYLAFTDIALFLSIATFFALVGLIINKLVTKASGRAAKEQHLSTLSAHGSIIDLSRSFRQLSISPNADSLLENFSEVRRQGAEQSAAYQVITSLPRYITEIAVMLGVGILVAQRVLGGEVNTSAPVVGIFLAGIFRIVSSMLPLQSALSTWKVIEHQSELSLSILNAKPVDRPSDLTPPSIKTGPLEVSADAVFFGYSGSVSDAIRGVSFTLSPGSFTALIGPSGAGKSTLADLVLGLRNPSSGSVKISGIPSRTFMLANRGRIAYVPQESNIFAASLRKNVSMNFGNSTELEVQRVSYLLKLVGLESLVNDSKFGLETLLGAGGMGLSGGQSQRIGLARALYSQPSLLVLDEATSALDDASQEVVQSAIEKLRGTITILAIAHRKETLRAADQILRLEGGHLERVLNLGDENDLTN